MKLCIMFQKSDNLWVVNKLKIKKQEIIFNNSKYAWWLKHSPYCQTPGQIRLAGKKEKKNHKMSY
jgi:hypothetical protein